MRKLLIGIIFSIVPSFVVAQSRNIDVRLGGGVVQYNIENVYVNNPVGFIATAVVNKFYVDVGSNLGGTQSQTRLNFSSPYTQPTNDFSIITANVGYRIQVLPNVSVAPTLGVATYRRIFQDDFLFTTYFNTRGTRELLYGGHIMIDFSKDAALLIGTSPVGRNVTEVLKVSMVAKF
jgi:hypothetical protein